MEGNKSVWLSCSRYIIAIICYNRKTDLLKPNHVVFVLGRQFSGSSFILCQLLDGISLKDFVSISFVGFLRRPISKACGEKKGNVLWIGRALSRNVNKMFHYIVNATVQISRLILCV